MSGTLQRNSLSAATAQLHRCARAHENAKTARENIPISHSHVPCRRYEISWGRGRRGAIGGKRRIRNRSWRASNEASSRLPSVMLFLVTIWTHWGTWLANREARRRLDRFIRNTGNSAHIRPEYRGIRLESPVNQLLSGWAAINTALYNCPSKG